MTMNPHRLEKPEPMTSPPPAGGVAASALAYELPGRTLWSDLTLSIAAGEFAALLGQSGSGKTTLLQCLGGLLPPSAGSLDVFGIDPAALRGRDLRRFRREVVGFAFQSAGVVASWTVRKNLEVAGFRTAAQPDTVKHALSRFALSTELLGTPVHLLSGGEQQRVGLARLALHRPQLLLMDEPTSALDDENTERVLDYVAEHCSNGGVAVIATHDPRLITSADTQLRL